MSAKKRPRGPGCANVRDPRQPHRWRRDGPDYITGCRESAKGPGGMVGRAQDGWTAQAHHGYAHYSEIKLPTAAWGKLLVEKWLNWMEE